MNPKINYVIGDATQPILKPGETGPLIVHCCNNVGKWGAGFTKALDERWDFPRYQYMNMDWDKPGELSFAYVQLPKGTHELNKPFAVVVNLIGQDGVRGKHNPVPVKYKWIEKGLTTLTEEFGDCSIHMPRIGCGLAGGQWSQIEPIINKTLIVAGFPVFVYDLPT